jgi:hypothetical protein
MKNKKTVLALFTCIAMGFYSCEKSEDPLVPEAVNPENNESFSNTGKYAGSTYQLVAQVRQVTTKYKDHNVALADGFFNTEDCISIPGVGGMGVHFVRFDRLDGVFNPLEPEVLVYEITMNGSYKLVAVEYLYVGSGAPMFAGEVMFHPFPGPFADYALHVWAWKANPAGLFEDWNPNVICP